MTSPTVEAAPSAPENAPVPAWTIAQKIGFRLLFTLGGGLLVQSADVKQLSASELKIVSRRAPTEQQLRDLRFAWQVAKFVSHHRGRGNVFADVDQAWRTWCLNHQEFSRTRVPTNGKPPGATADDLAAYARQLRAQEQPT